MVVTTENLHGTKLRIFKWNERLPRIAKSKGLFFIRVYTQVCKVTQSEYGHRDESIEKFTMEPWFILFEPNSLSCPCEIRKLCRNAISTPNTFHPYNISPLGEELSSYILQNYRFKNQSVLGKGAKTVIVVEVYRTRTTDHTASVLCAKCADLAHLTCSTCAEKRGGQEGENGNQGNNLAHACEHEGHIATDSSEDVIVDINKYDEAMKLVYMNEVEGILQVLKRGLEISENHRPRRVRIDKPKGMYEMGSKMVVKNWQGDEVIKECPVCLQEFLTEMEIVETPCAHIFHRPCMLRWLVNNMSCPMCRSVCITFV